MNKKIVESIEGKVKPIGNGAYITLPKNWIGKTVKVTLASMMILALVVVSNQQLARAFDLPPSPTLDPSSSSGMNDHSDSSLLANLDSPSSSSYTSPPPQPAIQTAEGNESIRYNKLALSAQLHGATTDQINSLVAKGDVFACRTFLQPISDPITKTYADGVLQRCDTDVISYITNHNITDNQTIVKKAYDYLAQRGIK